MVLDRSWKRAGAVLGLAVVLGVVGCGGGDDDGGGAAEGESVTLSFLVDNSEQAVKPAEALIAAFQKKNPNIKIKLETRPQGGEGDNLVKTRLATQEMTDIFVVQLRLAVPGAEARRRSCSRSTTSRGSSDLDDGVQAGACRRTTRSTARRSAAPSAAASSTTRRSTRSSGLEVPKTWDEFMANNAKIKAAGIDPVAPELRGHVDLAAVRARRLPQRGGRRTRSGPSKYTTNQVKYAQEPAVEGFQHLEEVNKAGLPEQELRLGEVRDGAEPARPGQGRALPDADRRRAEPRDLGPGQDRRHRLLRAARQRRREERRSRCGCRPASTSRRRPRATSSTRPRSSSRSSRAPRAATSQAKAFAPTGPYMVEGLRAARRRAAGDQGPPAVRRRRTTSRRRSSSCRRSRARRWSRSPSRSAPACASADGRRQALRRGRREAGPAARARGLVST